MYITNHDVYSCMQILMLNNQIDAQGIELHDYAKYDIKPKPGHF